MLTSEETRRDISSIRVTVPLFLDIRDTPATDRDFRADVDEREEREDVHRADAEYLLVLVRQDRVLVWAEVVDFLLDLCNGL